MTKETWLIIVWILFLLLDGHAEAWAPIGPNQASKDDMPRICIGLLAHDVDHLWSRSKKEGGVDGNAEMIFKPLQFHLHYGNIRPNAGISVNNRGDTSKIYGGVLWELDTAVHFFNVGVGLALHNGELETRQDDKKRLGARVLFRVPIETGLTVYDRHRISILFEHISNGYLAHPNEGLDSLGLRYSVSFD